jgi:hypothetical protein
MQAEQLPSIQGEDRVVEPPGLFVLVEDGCGGEQLAIPASASLEISHGHSDVSDVWKVRHNGLLIDDGRADVDVFRANGPLVTTSYCYGGRLSSVQPRSAEPGSRYAVREAAYALDGCGIWPSCMSGGTWS